MHASPDKRTRVLFINAALLAGADTWIHFLLLRNLSQGQFELHAAGQPGSPAPAYDALRAIPGIALRPTNFGYADLIRLTELPCRHLAVLRCLGNRNIGDLD